MFQTGGLPLLPLPHPPPACRSRWRQWSGGPGKEKRPRKKKLLPRDDWRCGSLLVSCMDISIIGEWERIYHPVIHWLGMSLHSCRILSRWVQRSSGTWLRWCRPTRRASREWVHSRGWPSVSTTSRRVWRRLLRLSPPRHSEERWPSPLLCTTSPRECAWPCQSTTPLGAGSGASCGHSSLGYRSL